VSVPSNIAEGGSRNTRKDYKRFLRISLDSAYELETLILLGNELDWFTEECDNIYPKTIEIQKMLSAMIMRL